MFEQSATKLLIFAQNTNGFAKRVELLAFHGAKGADTADLIQLCLSAAIIARAKLPPHSLSQVVGLIESICAFKSQLRLAKLLHCVSVSQIRYISVTRIERERKLSQLI